MTTRTKIDVHAETLSIEFGDTLVQFNIFEAMKHPTEDHSLFGIDLIDELVEVFFQLDHNSEEISNLAEDTKLIGCLGSPKQEADYDKVWEVHDLSNSENDNIDLADLSQKAETFEITYLDTEQQLPVIIASNLPQEQEDKLLGVLRKHKKAIGWKLSDLPGINPSIYMHRILLEEESKPIRQ
ncbi:hypothetical protein CR513_15393, partial [Mucuna pruriens]